MNILTSLTTLDKLLIVVVLIWIFGAIGSAINKRSDPVYAAVVLIILIGFTYLALHHRL